MTTIKTTIDLELNELDFRAVLFTWCMLEVELMPKIGFMYETMIQIMPIIEANYTAITGDIFSIEKEKILKSLKTDNIDLFVSKENLYEELKETVIKSI